MKKFKIIISILVIIATFVMLIRLGFKNQDEVVDTATDVSDKIEESEESENVISPTPTEEPTAQPTPTVEPTPTPTPVPKYINPFDQRYADFTIEEKIEQLREWFPDKEYWNTCDATEKELETLSQDQIVLFHSKTPCTHSKDGYVHCISYMGITHDHFNYYTNMQCLGFASFVSDFLFGKEAELTETWGFENIDVGDHIRLIQYDHSFIVIEKTEEDITLLEVNENFEDCIIEWDRVMTEEELATYVYKIYKREQ